MKTCAACGRPLASHGVKAALQSSEIGPKAVDAPCCGSEGTPTPDGQNSAQGNTSATKRPVSKPKGAKRQATKQRIKALREFARKKLGRFLPARITLRPRPTVEQTASEAPRRRRRLVRPSRTKSRHAQSEHVVTKPSEKVETSSPSEEATDAAEQSLETQTVEAQLEKRTEESEHVIATPTEQSEPALPSEGTLDGAEQSPPTMSAEAQLETSSEETEHVVSNPPEKVEAPLPSEAANDAAEQSAQNPPAEAQLENSMEQSATDTTLFQTEELVFVPWRADEPLEETVPAPETPALEEQAKTLPAQTVEVCKPEEPHTEPSTEVAARSAEPLAVDRPAEEPTSLETRVEKAPPEAHAPMPPAPALPAEPLDVSVPAPETPALEEQTKTSPPPAAELCKPDDPHSEQSIVAGAQSNEGLTEDKPAETSTPVETPAEQPTSAAYAMIPPAPSAPVPGRAEFEARLHTPANQESKESLVEEEPIELVPGLLADSAVQCELPTTEPVEPEVVTPKTEEAVEETKPTSVSLPPSTEASVPDVTNLIEQETAADMSTQTEDCLQQTLAPEPESETAGDQGGEDEAANDNLQQPAKKKVLVVDDDPTLRMLLKMGLEPHGYECLLAENGKAAQAVVQAHHPALILVDLLMPVMDGLAFVQWLRGTAKDSTPVLVFTNLDDAKVTQQALDSGANAFACKPLRLKELLQTMKELVPA